MTKDAGVKSGVDKIQRRMRAPLNDDENSAGGDNCYGKTFPKGSVQCPSRCGSLYGMSSISTVDMSLPLCNGNNAGKGLYCGFAKSAFFRSEAFDSDRFCGTAS